MEFTVKFMATYLRSVRREHSLLNFPNQHQTRRLLRQKHHFRHLVQLFKREFLIFTASAIQLCMELQGTSNLEVLAPPAEHQIQSVFDETVASDPVASYICGSNDSPSIPCSEFQIQQLDTEIRNEAKRLSHTQENILPESTESEVSQGQSQLQLAHVNASCKISNFSQGKTELEMAEQLLRDLGQANHTVQLRNILDIIAKKDVQGISFCDLLVVQSHTKTNFTEASPDIWNRRTCTRLLSSSINSVRTSNSC